MTDGKPVEVLKSALGGWYAVSASRDLGDGHKEAKKKHPISNAADLEKMRDAYDWLETFLAAVDKTRDELADDYNLVIGRKSHGNLPRQ